MSVSNADNRDRKRSDGNGCSLTASGKVPSFFNLFSARRRRSRAKNSDELCVSCGGSVDRINSRSSGKKRAGDGGCLGRAFCFGRPRALESTVASRSSDPNDPEYTPEMMRKSLEKNDFYSEECNPHSRR